MTDEHSIKEVYDRIAHHFSQTRENPWPEVTDFLKAVGGGHGVDIGCGNARHTEQLTEVVDTAVGVDISRGLLAEAQKRAAESDFDAEFVLGGAASLPIREDTVAVGLYIATIHHLRSRATRIASLDELARVLSDDGTALVSAWSTTHDQFDAEKGFDTTVDWTLPDGDTVPRFYHIYDPEEFEEDIRASELEPRDTWVSSGNCYAEVRSK